MITSKVCHAVTTIGIASVDPQLHSLESVFTMDHLSRAHAIIERIVTGEVFNLVQRGPDWIKSAIIPSNYYPAATSAVRLLANHPEGVGPFHRTKPMVAAGGRSESIG
jgi:hypothetical protein